MVVRAFREKNKPLNFSGVFKLLREIEVKKDIGHGFDLWYVLQDINDDKRRVWVPKKWTKKL